MPESDSKEAGRFKWSELVKVVALQLVTLIVGLIFNWSLNKRQELDNNVRLYADMMGRREEADSALRKDMFNSILTTFLKKDPQQQPAEYLETEVLNIDLLAHNFHESLDLGPLFKHLQRELVALAKSDPNGDLLWRLEKVAMDVRGRQVEVLADSGAVEQGTIDMVLVASNDYPGAISFSTSMVEPRAGEQRNGPTVCLSLSDYDGHKHYRQFNIAISEVRMDRREVELILSVSKPLSLKDCKQSLKPAVEKANLETKAVFWVGSFAFPMIDNTHLSDSERCSLTVTKFGDDSIQPALAYFNSSRASLKDKPYYNEVLHDLLHNPPQAVPQ